MGKRRKVAEEKKRGGWEEQKKDKGKRETRWSRKKE
jgi:hypothetical protein